MQKSSTLKKCYYYCYTFCRVLDTKKNCVILNQWLEGLSLMHVLDLSLFCNRHNFIPHKSNLCFQRG